MICWTIRKVSVLPHPTNPRISEIVLTSQMLWIPMVKEIFTEETLGNAWNHKNPRKISRTVNDRYIPISTSNHNIMSKYSAIGKSDTTTAPPCGINVSLKIDNIRKSATPDLRDSNKFDIFIDGKFTNNFVALPIYTDLISAKISNSSRWYFYARVGMYFTSDAINPMTPKFVDLELSNIDALDKGVGFWTPAVRITRPTDVSHWNTPVIFLKKLQWIEKL